MLNLDDAHLVKLSAEDIVQKHISVIGMTGSGKTMTLFTLVEETVNGGTKVVIVDPEGEFSNLRFGIRTVIVGCGRLDNHIDIQLTPDNAPAAADILCRYDIPLVILDLSGFNIETRDEFVLAYVGRMWELYQHDKMPPARLVIDEAQLFAPQRGSPVTKKMIMDMGSRARKYNLGLVFATQRPQRIEKDVLDATYIRIFHQLATGAALNAVKDLLPSKIKQGDRLVTDLKVDELVSNLPTGDALFMINQGGQQVHIRASKYKTDDRNQFVGVQMPFDDGALDELKRLITTSATADSMKAQVQHQAEETSRMAQLLAENEALRTENERLRGLLAQEKPAAQEKASDPVEAREVQREQHVDERERERQCRTYRLLIMAVKRHTKRDIQILSYLLDHNGTQFTANELSVHLGYSADTIPANPPTDLLKAKLIQREKVRGKFMYRSDLMQRAEVDFPLIGAVQLREDIAGLVKQS